MLAGERASEYPMLSDSVAFYNEALRQWMDGKDDVGVQLHVATELREWRKKLAYAYFVKDDAPHGVAHDVAHDAPHDASTTGVDPVMIMQ